MTSPAMNQVLAPDRRIQIRKARPFTWLRLLLIGIIGIGIVLRFSGFSDRVFWHDEAYTLLRASGQTLAELTQSLFINRPISVDQLQQFQQFVPGKIWIDTAQSLAHEEPQLTPLYFILVHSWVEVFGNSLVAVRSLSALLNLFAFPCFYWLAFSLFQSRTAGWVAMALFAVSPLQVYYAQEARPTSLWVVTLLLMQIAFVGALKRSTPKNWLLYAAATTLSLYTHLLTVTVMASHALYVLVVQRFRLNSLAIRYGLASGLAIAAFAPWLGILRSHFRVAKQTTAWLQQPLPLRQLFKLWTVDFQSIFLREFLIPGRLRLWVLLAVTALVVYALYLLYRQTAPQIWFLSIALIVPFPLLMASQDLILGGMRSANVRYFIPSVLGIQFAVSFLIAFYMDFGKLRRRYQTGWTIIIVMLLMLGATSSLMQLRQGNGSTTAAIADLINRSPQPLIISNETQPTGGTVGDILALSHLLKPEAQFQLVIDPEVPKIVDRFESIFLYKVSPKLEEILAQQYRIEDLHQNGLQRLIRDKG